MKIRSDEEIENYNKETFSKEKDELNDVDGYLLIDYIKQSIEMLMNMKMDESQKPVEYQEPETRNNKGKKNKNSRRYKDIDEPEIKIKVPNSKKKETIQVDKKGEE